MKTSEFKRAIALTLRKWADRLDPAASCMCSPKYTVPVFEQQQYRLERVQAKREYSPEEIACFGYDTLARHLMKELADKIIESGMIQVAWRQKLCEIMLYVGKKI